MKRCATVVCMLATLLAMATAPVASSAPAIPGAPATSGGWVTLMSEDFEGEFPHSPWHIGRTGDPYLWGQRSCNPHRGMYSMWAGGGGSSGSLTPCSGMYTPYYVTTLSYGPIDLTGASGVRVNFAHWTWLGAGDTLSVGYSNDGGASWQVVPIYGNAVSICDGWCVESWDQSRWSIPLVGRSRVYLLFRFSSDAADVSYGAFVDDVSLEAYYDTPPAPTATPTSQGPAATRRAFLPLNLRGGD